MRKKISMMVLGLFGMAFLHCEAAGSEIPFGNSIKIDSTIVVEHNVMMEMRDGVKLATDIYKMGGLERGPVLLSRSPYNKDGLWMSDRDRFLKAGYIIVSQDVRGRYASEGTFEPHKHETADGVDCIEWIMNQSWCDGNIGTFGGSYLGGTQWLPARENPSGLKAMVPEVTFSDMYEGNTHPGGVKVLHDLRWTVADILRDVVHRKREAGENVPTEDELPDVNTVLDVLPVGGHAMIKEYTPFYREWLDHTTNGSYWDSISPSAGYHNITAPAMNISGWYDIFIDGTIKNYMGMKEKGASAESRHPKLILGPWTHMNLTGHFPEKDFGAEASSEAIDMNGMKLRWYDRWLKGEENGIDTEDPVLIYVMGANQWRTEKDWPLPDTKYTNYYLHSNGNANTLNGDGTLSIAKPTNNERADAYTYDPMNAVPTVGGQVILPGDNSMGPRDQREVEQREDVLVYTTPVLDKPVEVTGNIHLKLYISSDAPDTDFAAKLVDVYPDGTAMILTNGIFRARYHKSFFEENLLEPGNVYELDINLLATSNMFHPGHRIRLEVSSSNFPQFERNSNTGGVIADETADQYRKAVNTVYHSEEHPSHLILPIIER